MEERSSWVVKNVKVLFLDRDGTINHDIGTYVSSREQFRLIERADEAVELAKAAGFEIVIVTNQAGLAKGIMSEEQLEDVHSYMNELFQRRKVTYDHVYYCPSHPDYPHPQYDRFIDCRKPGTGMVDRAIEDYMRRGMVVDREHSFFIGDKTIDIECAVRSGLRPVLVRTGHGEEAECLKRGLRPEYVADDLYDAVTGYILSD